MVALITTALGLLTTAAGYAWNWYSKREAARLAAEIAMSDELQAHAGDGKASVDIRDSFEQQVAELKRLQDLDKEKINEQS